MVAVFVVSEAQGWWRGGRSWQASVLGDMRGTSDLIGAGK